MSRRHVLVHPHAPRHHSTLSRQDRYDIIEKQNTIAISHLETQIRELNDYPWFSAEQKHRNSVRLFALIDERKILTQTAALNLEYSKLPRAVHNPALHYFKLRGVPDSVFAEAAAQHRDLRDCWAKRNRAHWNVFRSSVFTAREDVGVRERLLRIPLFALQMFFGALVRTIVRRNEIILRWRRPVQDLR